MLAVAGKALLVGDVEKAEDLIAHLELWEKLEDGAQVREKVVKQVKLFALKTYLIANLQFHEAYRVSQLGQLFGMEDDQVRSETVGWILTGQPEDREVTLPHRNIPVWGMVANTLL